MAHFSLLLIFNFFYHSLSQAGSLYFKQSQASPLTDLLIYGEDGIEKGHTHFNLLTHTYTYYDQEGVVQSYATRKKQEYGTQALYLYEKDVYLGQLEADLESSVGGFIFQNANDHRSLKMERSEEGSNIISFWAPNSVRSEPDAILIQSFNSNPQGLNLEFEFRMNDSQALEERLGLFIAACEAHLKAKQALGHKRKAFIKNKVLPSLLFIGSGIALHRHFKNQASQLKDAYLATSAQERLENENQMDNMKNNLDRLNQENQSVIHSLKAAHDQLKLDLKSSQELSEIQYRLFQDISDETRTALLAKKAQIERMPISTVTLQYEELKPTLKLDQLKLNLDILKEDRNFFHSKRRKAEFHLKNRAKQLAILQSSLTNSKASQTQIQQSLNQSNLDLGTLKSSQALLQNNLQLRLSEILNLKQDLQSKVDSIQKLKIDNGLKDQKIQGQTQKISSLSHGAQNYNQTLQNLTQDLQIRDQKILAFKQSTQSQAQTIQRLTQDIQTRDQKISSLNQSAQNQTQTIQHLTQEYPNSRSKNPRSQSVRSKSKNSPFSLSPKIYRLGIKKFSIPRPEVKKGTRIILIWRINTSRCAQHLMRKRKR